jgi:hypothetical protein
LKITEFIELAKKGMTLELQQQLMAVNENWTFGKKISP